MKSMTGFGRATVERDGLSCTLEIKSVNARYCDIFIKSNNRIGSVEGVLRQLISSYIQRGKVDVLVTLQEVGNRQQSMTINRVLKNQVCQMLVEEGFYASPDEVPLAAVMQIAPDWIQRIDQGRDDENLKAIVLAAAKPALEQLSTMRCREGDIIGADVCDRLGNMKSMIDLIDDRKQKAIDNYSRYLKERIQELLADTDLTINEDRFLQEVAMLADKTDITEEIVRFRSHVIQLKNTLAQSNSIGRKLDFIIQEMNREVNTMGSKASDATITDCVVQLKCELEKVREQIQNVE